MVRKLGLLGALALLAGCAPSGRDSAATAPSTTAAQPPSLPASPPVPAPNVARPSAPSPILVPEGALYVCVSEVGGVRQQTVIEFDPKVRSLCQRHPEMGPCQYERNACRRSGGRVYAAGGTEITPATEAAYDRKVMRVRLPSN